MSHATLTIDGHTILDDRIDPGQQRGSAQLAELINGIDTATRPWFKAAMMPLTESFITGQDITITIHTHPRGWTLKVEHP